MKKLRYVVLAVYAAVEHYHFLRYNTIMDSKEFEVFHRNFLTKTAGKVVKSIMSRHPPMSREEWRRFYAVLQEYVEMHRAETYKILAEELSIAASQGRKPEVTFKVESMANKIALDMVMWVNRGT